MLIAYGQSRVPQCHIRFTEAFLKRACQGLSVVSIQHSFVCRVTDMTGKGPKGGRLDLATALIRQYAFLTSCSDLLSSISPQTNRRRW